MIAWLLPTLSLQLCYAAAQSHATYVLLHLSPVGYRPATLDSTADCHQSTTFQKGGLLKQTRTVTETTTLKCFDLNGQQHQKSLSVLCVGIAARAAIAACA